MFFRKFKLFVALIVTLTITITFIPTTAFSVSAFRDVSAGYWAYGAIMDMAYRGIINGYPDGTFRPDQPVTRQEFAAIMVRALGFNMIYPSSPTFIDMDRHHWAYPYVETSKEYLMGQRTPDGRWIYRPEEYAIREEIAVAMVKAKRLDSQSVNERILDKYTDVYLVSPTYRRYVAKAIESGIMVGYANTFNPQGVLTRAQAAVLIYNASLISSPTGKDGKIVIDDEDITGDYYYRDDYYYDDYYYRDDYYYDDYYYRDDYYYDDYYYRDDYYYDDYYRYNRAPSMTWSSDGWGIHLAWDKINDPNLIEYRVVVSENDSTPTYPENGYMYRITDLNRCYADIDNSVRYTDGDFGGYLKYNDRYFVSVTAVYKSSSGGKIYVPGSIARIQYKKKDDRQYSPDSPRLTGTSNSSGIHLSWTKAPDKKKFVAYKVVISKYDPNPTYPENGTLYTMYDINDTSVDINNSKRYSKGDFGDYLTRGTKYYVSVATVYDKGVIYDSNVLYFEYLGPKN